MGGEIKLLGGLAHIGTCKSEQLVVKNNDVIMIFFFRTLLKVYTNMFCNLGVFITNGYIIEI